jgi:lipopolysaccharide/colanic/teichoic acid biosynthesis glycosyltransferase
MTDMSARGGIPRPVEVILASVGLVLTAPLMLAAAAAIVATSGRPALFRQKRVGLHGNLFTLLKLRTMRSSGAAPQPQVTARDDRRVTSVGGLLRRTKLDELPELWNVVRGDMSLVGPRPEVPELVDTGDPRWKEVLQVRPGLTDPVTLRFRHEELLMSSVEGDRDRFYRETLQPMKLQGYRDYLTNRSWLSDLRVLCDTGRALLSGHRGESVASVADLSGRPPQA